MKTETGSGRNCEISERKPPERRGMARDQVPRKSLSWEQDGEKNKEYGRNPENQKEDSRKCSAVRWWRNGTLLVLNTENSKAGCASEENVLQAGWLSIGGRFVWVTFV